MRANAPKLSIVIPVRNEGANLQIMVRMVYAMLECSNEVLVVCDSPEDNSVRVVESLKHRFPGVRLVLNNRRGVIHAIRAGVREASGTYVLIFAADEVGPVLAIDDMLELLDGGCDLVSCTRYAHGGRRLGGSLIGGTLSRVANKLLQWVGGSILTDCTTGIKIFRRDVFDRLNLESKPVGWVVALEMAVKAQLLEMKLGEVPIISIDRLYGGTSTFRLSSWMVEYLKWFLWGVREMRRIPKTKRSRIKVRSATYFCGEKVNDGAQEKDVSGNGRPGVHRSSPGR